MAIVDYDNIQELEMFSSGIWDDSTGNQIPGVNTPVINAELSVKWIVATTSDLVGWVNWLTFSATDYRTIAWSSWDISLSSWVTYTVTGSNTWAMSAITYMYLNTATSAIVATTTAVDSVWAGKILVCVGNLNADATKNATFQAFGTDWQWIFITADDIAADTITANEIAANTLTVTQIDAASINLAGLTWDLDDISNWTTYDKTTTNQVTWAGRAYSALNSSNRYQEWLSAADMSSATLPTNWLVIWSQGIVWRTWWVKTFEITAWWAAYFKWDLAASTLTWELWIWTSWNIDMNNGSWESIEMIIETSVPKIKFRDNSTDVWVIIWEENKAVTLAWSTVYLDCISVSKDFYLGDDLVVQDDCVIWWNLGIAWDFFVLGDVTWNFKMTGTADILLDTTNNRIKSWTDGEIYYDWTNWRRKDSVWWANF